MFVECYIELHKLIKLKIKIPIEMKDPEQK